MELLTDLVDRPMPKTDQEIIKDLAKQLEDAQQKLDKLMQPKTRYYFYVTSHGTVAKAVLGRYPQSDEGRKAMGNYFETRMDAQCAGSWIRKALHQYSENRGAVWEGFDAVQ